MGPPCGVSREAPEHDKSRVIARASSLKSLGLPPRRVVIALTGQISVVKGIWEFVEAAARVAARDRDVAFAVLVGEANLDSIVISTIDLDRVDPNPTRTTAAISTA